MSIEAKITELTEALKENTAALRDVLAASATTSAPAPKPAKKKAKAKKEEPAPEETPEKDEPAAEETPEKDEPATSDAQTPETPEEPATSDAKSKDELVAEISEAVKSAIVGSDDPQSVKDKWGEIRAEYGVERISDLDDIDKLTDALAKAKAL